MNFDVKFRKIDTQLIFGYKNRTLSEIVTYQLSVIVLCVLVKTSEEYNMHLLTKNTNLKSRMNRISS